MAYRLLVGIGNPGRQYERTRHNIGFMFLDLLAAKHGGSFREESRLQGHVAKWDDVYMLKPSTYVNLSGQAVRKVMDYYKISVDEVLVVVDDVATPFNCMKMREKGSAGGHNGLKSIQAHLNTQEYLRLKLGVGDRQHGSLSDHVLGQFSAEEVGHLPEFLEKAAEAVENLIAGVPLERVMNAVNVRPKKKVKGESVSEEAAPPRTGEIT